MVVALSFLACAALLVASLLSAEPHQQQPLITVGNGAETKTLDLLYELKKAEIIPTVIDEFDPLLTVSVRWENVSAEYGNTIDVDQTQDAPTVELIDRLPSAWEFEAVPQLTLVITDPDAPSRDNPEWSEVCHWIATNVKFVSTESDNGETTTSTPEEVMPYKPPGPPPKTGKHRYVLVALAPLNGTTEALDLKQPSDRRRWGFDHERQGLRKWADQMGLGVVGANFIYEQNEEQ